MKRQRLIIYYVIIVTIVFFVVMWILATSVTNSISDFLAFLIKMTFNPHQNFMFYPEIHYLPLPTFLYGAVMLSSILLWFFNRWLHSRNPESYPADDLKTFLLVSALTAFVFLVSLQTISITNGWVIHSALFSGKTEIEKLINKQPRESLIMAGFCKNLVSGPHKAIFETDLDISKDPGMLLHRSLAFYLYPIDIRGIHRGEPDVWIAFDKKDAQKYVPAGYKVLGMLNDQNIIAIKNQ